MMNDDLAAIAGRYEELVGKLQEQYGIASDKAKHQVDEFKMIVEELKKSNAKLIMLQTRSKRAKPALKKTPSSRKPHSSKKASVKAV
jgi:hypothetical protein